MVNAFTLLSIMQLAIGFMMFGFGIGDRTCIQVQYSFIMLPIWIGILAVITGFCGILFGRQHKIRDAVNLSMVSCLRALNTMCVGLSFLAFYDYSNIQALIGFQTAYNDAIADLPYDDPRRGKYHIMNNLPLPIDVATNTDTIQGVLAVIMFLCLAEMLIGLWIAMLDKSQMIFGSTPQRGAPRYMPQGSNVPGNQGYIPSNQPQQPQYAAQPTNYQIPGQQGDVSATHT